VKQLLIFSLLAVMVCASKWVMAVDGLPELSGLNVSTVGSNSPNKGGIFSLVSSKLTASISLTSEGELSHIMMTFKEQEVRCLNYGAVVPNIDGTRVELSGEVECSPTSGDKSERRRAQINGWFETKK